MMRSLTRIIVPAPVQNRSTRRKRSLGPVGYFRRAVSGQPSVCDWLISLQGSFPPLPPCRPPTLMDSLGEEYCPPTSSASKTLESSNSFLTLVVYIVLSRSSLYERSGTHGTPFEVALCFCFSH